MTTRDRPEATLDELGEGAILEAIFPVLEADSRYLLLGPGDDCAVLAAPDGRYVVSTDLVVENHDFTLDTFSAADVAGKVVGQNAADIAAMGAVPTGMVVGLVAPGDTPLAWVREFAAGLSAACGELGVVVAGGDLSGGPALMISVTVFGDLQGRAPVRRDGARAGDVVALAGTVGLAAAGLAALSGGRADDAQLRAAVQIQRSSAPQIWAGAAAAVAGAHAMIDVSDGLLRDAARVARASDVAIDLDAATPRLSDLQRSLVPAAESLGAEDPSAQAWQWLFSGGEDHGLLAVFPAQAELPDGFAEIGRVLPWEGPGGDARRVRVAGLEPDEVEALQMGWDHYGG